MTKNLNLNSVERRLGTGKGVVYKWVREFNANAEHPFPGKGQLKPPERELRDLKRELERVKRERDILKKAVAIFSKDPDRYSRS
jgi:transposase